MVCENLQNRELRAIKKPRGGALIGSGGGKVWGNVLEIRGRTTKDLTQWWMGVGEVRTTCPGHRGSNPGEGKGGREEGNKQEK